MRLFDNGAGATVKKGKLRGKGADIPWYNVCHCSADFDGYPSIADSNYSNYPPQKLRIPMKLFIRICLSFCAAALFANTANAQYLSPWSGWWGAGYYGSPAYSAPSYTSYYGSPSFGCCGTAAPVYAVSYGSCASGCCPTSCCPTSCCDPCGSGCASGACASGSCAGTTPAGSLKPAQDPISDKKTPDYEADTPARRFDPDGISPRTPRADDPLDPIDPLENRTDRFRSPRSGTGTGLNMTLELDGIRHWNGIGHWNKDV